MKLFIEVFGWYGAAGIVVVSFYKGAYQPGVLNIVWAGIALLAIGGLLLA